MKLRDQYSRAQMSDLCAQVHPEDGMEPSDWANEPGEHDDNHSAERLCEQVRRCVQACVQTCLMDLTETEPRVERVEPAPDAKRLRVTLSLGEDDSDKGNAVSMAIAAHTGMVRCAVAEAITRKRTPSLVWVVTIRNDDDEQ